MNTKIKLLDNENLKAILSNEQSSAAILIIDVREPNEYAREHIPGSINIPLQQLASTDFSKDNDKVVIFHCKLGNRTRSSAATLLATGFKETYCMEGGIEQWKACGFPVTINRGAPLEIMRQVQIIAGILILLGILLSYTVASAFILVSAMVGLGLLIAGTTGFCGMAKLLMCLPWNKNT